MKTKKVSKRKKKLRERQMFKYYKALEYLTDKDGDVTQGLCGALIDAAHLSRHIGSGFQINEVFPEFKMLRPMPSDEEYGYIYFYPVCNQYLPEREMILMFCAELARTGECENDENLKSE